MKYNFRIITASLLVLLASACQKPSTDQPQAGAYTISISEPLGEEIALFHYNGSSYEGKGPGKKEAIIATKSGVGQYSFDASGYEGGQWVLVAPYNGQTLSDDMMSSAINLSPIQNPGGAAADAEYRYASSGLFEVKDGSAKVSGIENLFDVLHICVSGLSSERIYAITIETDKTASYTTSGSDEALAGLFEMSLPANASTDTKNIITGVKKGTASNTLSALYPSGLLPQSGIHNIYLNTNSAAYEGISDAVVTICTEGAVYTGNCILNLEKGKVANIDLASCEVFKQPAINFILNNIPNVTGSIDLKATDSKSYTWQIKASNVNGIINLVKGSYMAIPLAAGKKITGLRAYMHKFTEANTEADNAWITLASKDGGAIYSYSCNQYCSSTSVHSLNMSGGVIDIPLSSKYDTMTGMRLTSSDDCNKMLSMITLLVEGEEVAHGELKADGNVSGTYNLITACGYQCSETPDLCGVHTSKQHISQSLSEELGKYVFDFFIHINEDNDRGHTDIIDRQRNEIKTDSGSPKDMYAKDNETLRMSWKFKLPLGMKTTSNFCHVHQIKGIGSGSNVSTPMITFTCRNSGSRQVFQIIYREESTSSKNDYLCSDVDLSEFLGEWVEVTETIRFTSSGNVKIDITRMSDGKKLLSLDQNRNFIRTKNPGYRPKWGIYRSYGDNGSLKSQMRDEIIQFADFKIEKL